MPGTIKYLDLSLPSPAKNLALDEALLDSCEAGGEEVLRFWEPPVPFVVMGYGGVISEDVDRAACEAEGIPILRRCSGGGTVLQGPGCLNYALILRIDRAQELENIHGANRHIMERHAAALTRSSQLTVHVEGHTDLAVDKIKFSGNAQRRKRTALLFHGTFLLEFDLSRVERFLRLPPLQPRYRANRSHPEFLRNLPLSSCSVKDLLREIWQANEPLHETALPTTNDLEANRYGCPEWNFRR